MSKHTEEAEIKIEYFETFDVDPLHFLHQKLIKDPPPIINTSNLIPEVPKEESDNDNWYKQIDDAGKYICKFCVLSYSTIQTLRNHVRVKHNTHYEKLKSNQRKRLRSRKFKCHVCKLRYKDILNLQEHVRIHGINNIKKSCIKCWATFENEADMLTHVANEHGSLKNKLHFCSICGYSTSKLSHYKQHSNIHMHNNKKVCLHCDYSTNRPSNLKIHEQIHAKEKPYICGFNRCVYRCATKSGLNSHMLKHDKCKNTLYCDKCSYNTVYKSSLNKHIDSHTRNNVRKR